MKSAGVCGPFMLVDSSHVVLLIVMMTIVHMLSHAIVMVVLLIVMMTIGLMLCVITYSRCISRGPL
jgi:hypothetical protein